jgi:hypothetical protein
LLDNSPTIETQQKSIELNIQFSVASWRDRCFCSSLSLRRLDSGGGNGGGTGGGTGGGARFSRLCPSGTRDGGSTTLEVTSTSFVWRCLMCAERLCVERTLSFFSESTLAAMASYDTRSELKDMNQ